MKIRFFYPVPIDRCKINTLLPLKEEFFKEAEIADLAFRDAGHEWYHRNSTSDRFKDGHHHFIRISLCNFSALTLMCKRTNEGWQLTGYELNPAAILYGHTGHNLEREELAYALVVARDLITPMLVDPKSAWKLTPSMGDIKNNPSYWSYVEIPLNLYDPTGSIWQALSNVHYPHKHTGIRYEKESMTIGNRRSDLSICIYRRGPKMEKFFKKYRKDSGNDDVEMTGALETTRVEVRLRKDKLLEHLGTARSPENVASIDGKLRLIRFTGNDLVAAHLSVIRKLQGIRKVRDPSKEAPMKTNKLGRMLGIIAATEDIPLERLFQLYEDRFGPSKSKTDSIRPHAREEYSAHIPFSIEELFTESKFDSNPQFSILTLEKAYEDTRQYAEVDPELSYSYFRRK